MDPLDQADAYSPCPYDYSLWIEVYSLWPEDYSLQAEDYSL